MRRRFDLTDFEWAVIEPLLPNNVLSQQHHRLRLQRSRQGGRRGGYGIPRTTRTGTRTRTQLSDRTGRSQCPRGRRGGPDRAERMGAEVWAAAQAPDPRSSSAPKAAQQQSMHGSRAGPPPKVGFPRAEDGLMQPSGITASNTSNSFPLTLGCGLQVLRRPRGPV